MTIIIKTQAEYNKLPKEFKEFTKIEIRSDSNTWIEVRNVPKNSHVSACDSSYVSAHDSSYVSAHDSSQVIAYDSSQVTAYGSSQVRAYDSSQVIAYGSSHVIAYGSSQVSAYGSSQVIMLDSCKLTQSKGIYKHTGNVIKLTKPEFEMWQLVYE